MFSVKFCLARNSRADNLTFVAHPPKWKARISSRLLCCAILVSNPLSAAEERPSGDAEQALPKETLRSIDAQNISANETATVVNTASKSLPAVATRNTTAVRLLPDVSVLLQRNEIADSSDPEKPDVWQNARPFGKRLDQATIGTEPIDPMNPPSLAIWLLSFGSDQLTVFADYFNLTGIELTLHGRKITDPIGGARQFYPYAYLEVSDENDRDWRIIGNSPEQGNGEEVATVMVPIRVGVANPQADQNETCVIDLNPFRPFVGEFRYGRVVLKDGGSSQVIVLTDLLPPETK